MQVLETKQPFSSQESKTQRVPTSLELFAGAGGLALGTHAAGFRHLGLIEWDEFAVQTLRNNSQRVLGIHPNLIFQCDVRNFDYSQFTGKIDLLSGGPPCQPFSHGGRSQGPEDDRDMFPTFLDTVATIMPNAILIENVKGVLRKNFSNYFNYILKRLQFPLFSRKSEETWKNHYQRLLTVTDKDFLDEEQYKVTYQLVNTSDYGVPQSRERVIISAFRRDLGIDTFYLKATHSKEALLTDQWITGTYWTRHKTLPYDNLSSQNKKILETLQNQLFPNINTLPWMTVRDAICDLPTPVDRGQAEKFPNHIQHPGARIYPGHSGSSLDYPAKALKAGVHGTPGGENVLYLQQEGVARYFTAREAARLQSFPDEWHFHGSWGACIKQLGNAVPREIIKLFSKEISQRLVGVSQ